MGEVFMIEIAWPYVFLLIPLPWLVYRYFPSCNWNASLPLKVPVWDDFVVFQKNHGLRIPSRNLSWAFTIWFLLLTSASRPQHLGERVEIPQSGRDLMLAVDLSGSMQFKDFEINGQLTDRLSALKVIVSDFIERRKGDRVGLILFGAQAYLQTPLTFDLATVEQLLMESFIGLAGNETAIGDAIGLAVKQLRDSPEKSRVLVLLTDGNSNAGELSVEKAAELSEHAKLKIYTVAIGSKEAVVPSFFGPRRVALSSEIDEELLRKVAEKTGGQYFRAYNTAELAQIYRLIDQLEMIERTNQSFRPVDELYAWPLGAAFACMGIWVFYSLGRRRLT